VKPVRKYADFYKTALGGKVLRREAGYIRRHLQGCNKILDVGCGPGVFERELNDMNIVGVDIDAGMINAARKNSGNEFICTPAGKLPFPNGSFDGVFFITSLEFMDELKKPVDEAVRVLSTGGKIAALILNKQSDYFREKMGDEGYIARNIRHTDLGEITSRVSERFEVEGEYFLGIKDGRVFDSDNPRESAIYALRGTLR